MIDLKKKVVLITGASSGIGRATALAFAHEGAQVVAVARNRAKLQSLQAQLAGDPSSHLFFPADITQEPMMTLLLSKVKEKYGHIDILIHNAGVGYLASFEKMKMETMRQVFELNFFAVVRLTQLAIPLLKASKGHVINVSSVIGRVSVPHYIAYCSSKFALEAFSEALRPELSPYGIKVTTFCPSLTATNFSENAFREEPSKEKWSSFQSATHVALKIVQTAKRPKRDVVLSLGGNILIGLHRWCPRFLDRVFKKQVCDLK